MHQERQRYCHVCNAWLHLACIGDAVGEEDEYSTRDYTEIPNGEQLEIPEVDGLDLQAIFEKVLTGPMV